MVEAETESGANPLYELPPRTQLEYANKILTAKYSERGGASELLNIDLILANLTPPEREAGREILAAYAAIMDVERAYDKVAARYQKRKLKSVIKTDYELDFSYLIDSSRALAGRTLDAATVQRISQISKHEEKGQQQLPFHKRLF